MNGYNSSGNGRHPDGADAEDDHNASHLGFWDAEVLQRLANDFFHDLPEAGEVISAAASELRADPAIFSTGLPLSEGEPALNSADGWSSHAQASQDSLGLNVPSAQAAQAIDGWGSRGVPGGLSQGVFSTDAVFGWLSEIRPLFESPAWSSAPEGPGVITVPPISDSFLESAAPYLGGLKTPASDRATRLLPSFLGELRSVTAAEAPRQPGANGTAALAAGFDVAAVRRDFPILQERVNGQPLVWLDNAATTQKPRAVIDRLSYFYEHENSNVHRAAHTLAARSTDAYEAARDSVRRFLNASSPAEIIFVRGATEGVNLVAQSWGRANIARDDEIVITWLEHHANIVPWQMLAAETGARLLVAPVDDNGQVILGEYQKLLGPRTKLVAVTQVSNALGTITPVQEMAALAHRAGARVLVDGAQAVSHMPVDVQSLGADFYVFSGHKVFGPTGIGVVYGRSDVLESTPPWQGGGNMIVDVTFQRTQYQSPPTRFEAGTGNIADAVGLGAALDYVQRIGMANIARYEHELLLYATEALQRIPGLRLIGTAPDKAGVLSFVLQGFETEAIGTALSSRGIAVRAGHHCAQPILRRFGVESTVRPSLALYNVCDEIDALVAALWEIKSGRVIGPN